MWALGVCAIEMAETVPPRWAVHPVRVIFMISRDPPPRLTRQPERWSPLLHDFVSQALIKVRCCVCGPCRCPYTLTLTDMVHVRAGGFPGSVPAAAPNAACVPHPTATNPNTSTIPPHLSRTPSSAPRHATCCCSPRRLLPSIHPHPTPTLASDPPRRFPRVSTCPFPAGPQTAPHGALPAAAPLCGDGGAAPAGPAAAAGAAAAHRPGTAVPAGGGRRGERGMGEGGCTRGA